MSVRTEKGAREEGGGENKEKLDLGEGNLIKTHFNVPKLSLTFVFTGCVLVECAFVERLNYPSATSEMCSAPVKLLAQSFLHQDCARNSFRQNGLVESSFYRLCVLTVSLPAVNVEAYNFQNVKCLFGADLFWRSDVCASGQDGGILRLFWGVFGEGVSVVALWHVERLYVGVDGRQMFPSCQDAFRRLVNISTTT